MTSPVQEANTTVKSVYRSLLKAVKQHIGKEEHKSHFIDYIGHEFRKNANSHVPQI